MTGSGRRRAQASSNSPQSTPESSGEQQAPASPALPNESNSPQSAPSGRRSSKTLQHALSFSTPGSSRIVKLRTRPKAMDDYNIDYGEDDHDSPRKGGGHTLRRRARVDYTFEHIDDQVVVPSSTSSTRSKKRRSDTSNDLEDVAGQQGTVQRGASVEGDTPSSRRRNPLRKTSEVKSYTEDADDDEKDVQDTIEVGVSYSDDERSSLAQTSTSNPTAGDVSVGSPQVDKPPTATEGTEEPSTTNIESATVKSTDENAHLHSDSADAPAGPEEQLQGEARGADKQANDVETAIDKPEAETQSTLLSAVEQDLNNSSKDDTRQTTTDVKLDQTAEDNAEPKLKRNDDGQSLNDVEVQPIEQTPGQEDAKESALTDEEVDPDVSMATVGEEREPPEPKDEQRKSSAQENESAENERQSPSQQLELPKTEVEPAAALEVPSARQSKSEDEGHAQNIATADEPEIAEESQAVSTDNAATDIPTTAAQEDDTQRESHVTTPGTDDIMPMEGVVPTGQEQKSIMQQSQATSVVRKPQPTPVGRWANLTPYVDDEYITYPEKKESIPDDETPAEEPTADEKEADKDTDKDADKDAEKEADKYSNDMEPMVEDDDEAPDNLAVEASTPALNTPTRGSPVPESLEPTASNSPAPAAEDGDDAGMSGSEDGQETRRYFRYRKLRDPEEYISAIENYEDMTTTELYELLEAVNVSLVQWQTEWTGLGKIVDDYENSLRRRLADSKYESRTRNLHQHGINYEEPEFVVKGYKAKERESMTETRYLQSQDRIMAAAYGFEYDPHPSKIGKQNPETQQVGIMTRGRSLRNQPRQTAKASEADEVSGKRSRKPVQLFDPAAQDVSRSSTPQPTRTRRRRNGEDDVADSFNGDANSEADEPPSRTRRRRGQRPKTSAPNSFNEEYDTPQDIGQNDITRSGRRGRVRPASRYDEAYAYQSMEDDAQRHPKRHLLTLKIPRGKNFSEPSSAITDNGDSRPSTASSESSSHTAESSYSFRPKRQKRFRDEQDEAESTGQAPPKKRGKRSAEDVPGIGYPMDSSQGTGRKAPKIKVVRAAQQPSRNGTPSSVGAGEGDEARKDYKLMTKSEKMSASMKSKISATRLIECCG